jgi:hypothetical protein
METQISNNKSLKLTENSLIFMAEVVKWAKFLAICSFVVLGIMLLIGAGVILIQFQDQAEGFSAVIMGVFYILMAVLYFFPAMYLHRFATATANAIEQLNDDTLEEGLEQLKSLFRFTGILMIIILSLYAVGILSTIAVYLIKM